MCRFYSSIIWAFLFMTSSFSFAQPKPFSTESIQKFFKTEVPRLMKKHHIVGATLSVVHNGKIVLSKGYGFSDLKKKKKVEPQKTLFRVGSISKLFTWTAAMQLVEEGKLDLNKDINFYLKSFQIPKTYAQPITFSHLMSHTPGFEDQLIGLFSKDPKVLTTLENTVKSGILKRVRPSGQEPSYSNYGTMLAGYIVEKLSGKPFERVIKDRIFKPLGMHSSTFHQPVSAALMQDLSQAYSYEGKKFKEEAFELILGAPAGAMSATATDMARFILAHLQLDSSQDKRILKPKTQTQMHSCHYRWKPSTNCMAHGFIEFHSNSPRILGHGGDTMYFHSTLAIIPEHQFGFFISTNTSTGGRASFGLLQSFIKRFLHIQTGQQLAKKIKRRDNLEPFLGTFVTNRRSESDMTKLFSIFMSLRIQRAREGGIQMYNFFLKKMQRYVQVAPMAFQEFDGIDKIVFKKDRSGKINSVIYNSLPVMLFVRSPWYESATLQIIILLFFALMLVSSFFLRPTGVFTFFSKKAPLEGSARIASFLGFTLILVDIGFFIGLKVALGNDPIFNRPSIWPFFIPYLILSLTLVIGYFCIQAWTQHFWGLWGRIHYTLFLTASTLFLCFLGYWQFFA